MLKGSKVTLDVIDVDNIEWMRAQRNQPEMRQYFREWKDISKDQQAKWYASRGNNSDPNHVYFQIAVREELKGTLSYARQHSIPDIIGCCGLHYVDWRLRSAEFGIFLSQDVRGQGFGKDALTVLFDYGFREMNLHKIWAEVYDNNQAINTYTKGLGMKQDGLLRDNYFKNGKYGNSIMLSVLEDEWFEAHGGR